jgi:hypothetical protein
MGIKRLIIVSLIVLLVLGLVVLLLFQTGADEQVINSLLPKIEERLDVDIQYESASTSLTSLELNGFEVRSKDDGCTYVFADQLGLNVRVGPLFVGKIDITKVRLDGLDVRVGKGAKGCGKEAWGKLVATLSKRRPAATKKPPEEPSRPEILITSGKMYFKDNGLSFDMKNFTGRIGDDAKTVLEMEELSLLHDKRTFATSKGAKLRYEGGQRHISVLSKGAAFSIPVIGKDLLSLLRDVKDTEQTWREALTQAVPGDGDAKASPRPGAPFSLSLTVKDADGRFVDSETPQNDLPIQNITVDAAVNTNRSLVMSASGQLPGTDTRFVLQVKRAAGKDPAVTLEIPDMSIAELGGMILPNTHVDWRHASLDGKLQAFIENDGQKLLFNGQAVVSDISIQHDKLAATPLPHLILDTDFKLEYDRADNVVHLERFVISRNMARMILRGDIHLDRLAFDLYLNLPRTACKHIKAGLPEPFTTRIKTTTFDGQLALDMHLSLDEANPEGVVLEAGVDNRCRIVDFGDLPEPGYFKGPFAYITYDENSEPLRLVTGPGTDRWVALDDISPYLVDAVLTTEDGKFWKHHGITLPEIRRAIELNLKKHALSHGASTITMQLAKNLFLGRERTVARKLQEVIMVWYLESYFSKEDILELYFNVIEYGPSLYGIRDAAMHYFGRSPRELNALESVFLIKMLPSPLTRYRIYEKGQVTQRQMALFHRVLRTMHERHRLSDAELAEALSSEIVFYKEGSPLPPPRPPVDRRASSKADSPYDTMPAPEGEHEVMMQEQEP